MDLVWVPWAFIHFTAELIDLLVLFNIVSKVEQALTELDSQMEELRKVQVEQDVLAAKTAEVTIWLLL